MLANLINESKFKALMKAGVKKGVIMAGRSNATEEDIFYFSNRHFMVKLPIFPSYMFELFGSIPNKGEEITVDHGVASTKFNDSMSHLFRTTQESAKHNAHRLSLTVDVGNDKSIKSARLFSIDDGIVMSNTELDALIPATQHSSLCGNGGLSPIAWSNGIILPIRVTGAKENLINELGFLFPNKTLEAVR